MYQLLLSTALILLPGTSFALSCVPDSQTPAERYAGADGVFIGRVVAEENNLHTVEVEKVWKGVGKPTVTVRSDPTWGTRLSVGEKYLFFAAKGQEADFDLPLCSENVFEMSNAYEHLRFLGYEPLMDGWRTNMGIALALATIGGGAWYFFRRA